MRSLTSRLGILSLIILILVTSSLPGTLASPEYAPMPPGDFELYKSDHFDIYYDSIRITDLSGTVMAANTAYDNVTAFFGNFDYRDRIILASSHSQYGNILYNYLTNENISNTEVASGWGDAERGTIVIESPDQLPDFQAVLTHQFTHIVMRTKLIGYKYDMPQWFSEGLAIYLSGDISDPSKTMVEDACRDGKMMTVAQIEEALGRPGDSAAGQSEADLAYAQSGMLMKYVVEKYGEENVKLIMQDYATSGDLEKAFMRRLGYSPEGVNADWQMTLKSELSVRDGVVTSERVQGYVYEPGGKPAANETIIFMCMRNDSAVMGKVYSAKTNGSGFYRVNLTYGLFKVQVDRDGYKPLDNSITLQKGETRLYNVTLATPDVAIKQDLLTGPEVEDNSMIYIALGVVNVLAILLIIFIFWRARK